MQRQILPFVAVAAITAPQTVYGSLGDRSQDFLLCRQSCTQVNCPQGPQSSGGLPWSLQMLGWTCEENCGYECMHSVTEMHKAAGISVRQFYGKWPFSRLMGIQEPASVAASLLNFAAHIYGLKWFMSAVPAGYEHRRLWIMWSLLSLNAWVWSSVFHTRDLLWTEKMDYFSATAAIMYQTYAAAVHTGGAFVAQRKSLLAAILAVYFVGHVLYLTLRHRFDYGYNMAAMVSISVTHSVWWLLWCAFHWREHRHAWKCAAAIIATGLLMGLELGDFPPLLGHFDAHSLWHFGTAFTTLLWYSFLVDDCQFKARTD